MPILSNIKTLFLLGAAAAALGGAVASPCLAQGGQAGAYADAIRQYEALLQDPNLDASTRQQVESMIATLEQQEANMTSLNPSAPEGSEGRRSENADQAPAGYGGRDNSTVSTGDDGRGEDNGDHYERSAQ
jgi:hypothetical protein